MFAISRMGCYTSINSTYCISLFTNIQYLHSKKQGHADHLAMFAVSCMGCEAEVQRYEALNDDYSKIMAQALADRYIRIYMCILCMHVYIHLHTYICGTI